MFSAWATCTCKSAEYRPRQKSRKSQTKTVHEGRKNGMKDKKAIILSISEAPLYSLYYIVHYKPALHWSLFMIILVQTEFQGLIRVSLQPRRGKEKDDFDWRADPSKSSQTTSLLSETF